jgi:hypothetical protein
LEKEFMHLSRLTMAIGAGVLALATAMPAMAASAATTAAPASANFAARATSYQNAALKTALRRMPEGRRISPSQVEWRTAHGGLVVMTVPAKAGGSTLSPDVADSCPAPIIGTRWSCVYNLTNFAGTRLQFTDAGPYQDLHAYGGTSWETFSWSNTRGQRAWLNQFANHQASGNSFCMTGNAHGSNITGNASVTDRWIYLSSNYDPC